MLKDSAPFVAIASGGSLMLTTITPVQLAGLVLGGVGAIVAILRMIIAGLDWYEKRRANNLNILKYEDEKLAKSQNSTKAEGQQSPGNGKSKSKETKKEA